MNSDIYSAMLGYGAQLTGASMDMMMQYQSKKWKESEARKVREWNEEMYEKQLADQRENWRMMNEYNLPSAQLARLRDAGLNPLLMYEGGMSQVATSPAQGADVKSAPYSNPSLQTNFGQALAGAALLKAQIENINADTEQKKSVSRQNNINSDINEATKDIQIAMKYGENDLLNQSISNMSSHMLNEAMVTAEQCATLAQGRIYQIKHYNLSETEVGNNYMIGLGNVANGKVQASAAATQAAAALKNAITQAKLTDAQVGLLIKNAAHMQLENEYLEKTMPYRVGQSKQLYRKSYFEADSQSWESLLKQSNISLNQSNIFLNSIRGSLMQTQQNATEQNMLLQPAGLLIDYGSMR